MRTALPTLLLFLLLGTCARAQGDAPQKTGDRAQQNAPSNWETSLRLDAGRTVMLDFGRNGPVGELAVETTRLLTSRWGIVATAGFNHRRYETGHPSGGFLNGDPFPLGDIIIDFTESLFYQLTETHAFAGLGFRFQTGRVSLRYVVRGEGRLRSRFEVRKSMNFLTRPQPSREAVTVAKPGEPFREDGRTLVVDYDDNLLLRHQLGVDVAVSPRFSVGLSYLGLLRQPGFERHVVRFCATCPVETDALQDRVENRVNEYRTSLRYTF